VATDDAVWARLVGTGTQSGPFTWTEGVTVNATNSAVAVEMMVIARFVNGKIAEQRLQYDALGLLGQLKAVSSPDTYLTEQRNLGLVRLAVDRWNRHDIEAMTAMPADPRHFTWAWGIDRLKTEQHPEGATRSMFENGVFFSFPDLQLTITNLVARYGRR
jgi:predicted ester cyclase